MSTATSSLILGFALLFFGILFAGLFGGGSPGGKAAALILLIAGIVFIVAGLFVGGSPSEGSSDGVLPFVWACPSCDFENVYAANAGGAGELRCLGCGVRTTMDG